MYIQILLCMFTCVPRGISCLFQRCVLVPGSFEKNAHRIKVVDSCSLAPSEKCPVCIWIGMPRNCFYTVRRRRGCDVITGYAPSELVMATTMRCESRSEWKSFSEDTFGGLVFVTCPSPKNAHRLWRETG